MILIDIQCIKCCDTEEVNKIQNKIIFINTIIYDLWLYGIFILVYFSRIVFYNYCWSSLHGTGRAQEANCYIFLHCFENALLRKGDGFIYIWNKYHSCFDNGYFVNSCVQNPEL